MDKIYLISGSILFAFGIGLALLCSDFVGTHLDIMAQSIMNVLNFRFELYLESLVNCTVSWILLFPFWICWSMGTLGIAIGFFEF